eukprot:UN23799
MFLCVAQNAFGVKLMRKYASTLSNLGICNVYINLRANPTLYSLLAF